MDESMFPTSLLAVLILGQDPVEDWPLLSLGETLEGEITASAPSVHTPALDTLHSDAPVLGRTFVVEVEESGPYTIELRSLLFDAYLVLRDIEGRILVEDDDGGVTIHARITAELETRSSYLVEACALHGERGAFELELRAGRAAALSPDEERATERAELERTLEFREKVLGPEHPHTATSLNHLATFLQAQGDYAAARPLLERALAICERVLGPEHVETAQSLGNLALVLESQGDYAGALALNERALAICERSWGPEHPYTARSLGNLAALHYAQGDYAAARPLNERALAIYMKTLGPADPYTVEALNNLASVLHVQGDLAAARPLFERALALCERVLGPEDPETAYVLNNMGLLLRAQWEYAAARPLLERALAIREKVLGPEHPETATSLNNLALLLDDQGDFAVARPLYERALAIKEKLAGPEHPETATLLNNLGLSHYRQSDFAAARPLYERALAIREKVLGPGHADTAQTLNNLALLLYAQGDCDAARPLYERALAIREETLGPEHPDTAISRYNLAIVLADCARSESFDVAREALSSSLAHAESTLWSLSEKERLLFLGAGEHCLQLFLSLAKRVAPAGTATSSYDLALAWRGLSSRTLLESRARLEARSPAGAVALIEDLHGVQARLSKLLYANVIADRERHEREIRAMRERRNELEVELQRIVGPGMDRPLATAELRASLPPRTAFLDFLVHPLYEPAAREGETVVRKGQWADHLSAWIVRPERELVPVDLGPAEPIELAVQGWLEEIVDDRLLVAARGIATSAEGVRAASAGEQLRALLWEPLARELEGVERVFVRLDGFLGTLPLEVIPLVGGKYLIEEKSFVYVHAPHDIIATPSTFAPGSASLLITGGLDFRSRAELSGSRAAGQPQVASTDVRGARQQGWPELPFTRSEADAIEELHESAVPDGSRLRLLGDQATEERLKHELPRYSIAHLATHGFFNPEGTLSMWDSAREAMQEELHGPGLESETRALVGALPGLLTGLVCAGANEPAPEGRDDGLLTAEEVLWLDLSHVDLVVLSACETALGERRSGEGMIGLRRAFGLAGAKTVVSSLWSVKDRSTSELMQSFYEGLLREKQGRAEALRNAQLEMLARNRATEGDALPSTWGAFVLSGEWR